MIKILKINNNMNFNKTKSINRLMNIEPDERIVHSLSEIYENYLISSTKPLGSLSLEFHEYFKNERIISFRQKSPKSLNQRGEGILLVSKL